jgi:hypothetical protein
MPSSLCTTLAPHRRRARFHSAAAHAQIHRASRRRHMREHMSRPFHRARRDRCGQRRVRHTRDAGGTQTNKSRNRPRSLASKWHEDGACFRQPRADAAEERLAVYTRVHALVCLCARACVFVCMHLCVRAACVRECVCVFLCGCAGVRVCACPCLPPCARACMLATHFLTSPPTCMRNARGLGGERTRTAAAALL